MHGTHRLSSLVMLLILLIAAVHIPSFEGATHFSVTDTKSGENFTLSVTDSEVTINSQTSIYIDSKVVDVCCFDSIFTFLCATETTQNNFVHTIYTYNNKNGDFSSFATDSSATWNNDVFTADGKGRVYILNDYDSTVIHCYEKGLKSFDIQCNSNIVQMMCVAKDRILLFSVDGVYMAKDYSVEKISSLIPVSPCRYLSDGIIVDNAGNEFIYKNHTFEVYTEETINTKQSTESPDNPIINHESKDIFLSQGTTTAKLIETLGLQAGDISIKDAKGSTVTSGKLCTDMKIIAGNVTYSVIIRGDLTGEGNVNSRDLNAIMKHLTGEKLLYGSFAKAADLDADGDITTKDLLSLARLY